MNKEVFCHNKNVINIFEFFSYIVKYGKVIIPILLIMFIVYRFIKSNKFNIKNNFKFVFKILCCIFLYFIPNLIYLFLSNFSIIDNTKMVISDCIKCLNEPLYCKELKDDYLLNDIWNDNNQSSSEFEPILPDENANVIKSGKTKTLIYSIEQQENESGPYYITRIWVKKPYLQLNKFDSPQFGYKLYKAKYLLEKASIKNKLYDKIMVGFSASGFHKDGRYQQAALAVYPFYDKTPVGTLVITDGKVVRNYYNYWYKTWTIMGINKDNQMLLFQDSRPNSSSDKKIQNQEIIDSGIRNTFTFASPLIVDGKASNIISSMPNVEEKLKRQAICQINKNNFALITSNFDYRTFTRQDLIDIMLSLNCQTGTNLDGGGSISLLVKDANSNDVEVITGNKRDIVDVGYFTELEDF